MRTPVSANTRRMKKIVLPQGGSRQTENVYTLDVDQTREVGGAVRTRWLLGRKKQLT